LFQTLSSELGAKNNLKSSLEKWRVSNVSHVGVSHVGVSRDFVHIGGDGHIRDVNVCGDSLPSKAVPHPLSNEQTPNQNNPRPKVRLDLADAPDVSPFYGRTYEDYRILWKQVGELSHNSCLLLNSWSPPREMASLAGENLPARSIRLSGFGAAAGEILRDFGLADSTEWETLINTYRGHPLWLKIIATMIQDI